MFRAFIEKFMSSIATFPLHCGFVQKKQPSTVNNISFSLVLPLNSYLQISIQLFKINHFVLMDQSTGILHKQHQILILHYFQCYITSPQYYSIHVHVNHNIICSSKAWSRGKYIASYWKRNLLFVFCPICLFFIRKYLDSFLCVSPIYLLNSPFFTFILSDLKD